MPRQYDCLANEGETCNGSNEGCENCREAAINKAIKKHMLSKHSSLLFQRFNEIHPNYQTVSPRAMSVYTTEDSEGDETCYYDKVQDGNDMNKLMSLDLSEIENKIVMTVLNGSSNIKFDAGLYNCSIDEFNDALDGLKDKMTFIGMDSLIGRKSLIGLEV